MFERKGWRPKSLGRPVSSAILPPVWSYKVSKADPFPAQPGPAICTSVGCRPDAPFPGWGPLVRQSHQSSGRLFSGGRGRVMIGGDSLATGIPERIHLSGAHILKAVFFNRHGGPEVLEYGDLPDPEPGPGEALVRLRAAALNHVDIWVRVGWPGLDLRCPMSLARMAPEMLLAWGRR